MIYAFYSIECKDILLVLQVHRLKVFLLLISGCLHAQYILGGGVAALLKRGQALPLVDEHLLEQVGYLVLVVGEHVAYGVNRAAVLPDHSFKFMF